MNTETPNYFETTMDALAEGEPMNRRADRTFVPAEEVYGPMRLTTMADLVPEPTYGPLKDTKAELSARLKSNYARRLQALQPPTQGELDLLASMATQIQKPTVLRDPLSVEQPEPMETRKPNKHDRRRLRHGIERSLRRSGSVLSPKHRAKAMAFQVVQEGSR